MNHFISKNGLLHCEGVSLEEIAASVGTPVYVYSTATLSRHYQVFKEAFAPADVFVAYAVKANSNIAVLATLAKLGAGMDTVSAGEVQRCLAAGIEPNRIIFSGIGKTEEELVFAIELGLHQINVESAAELELIERISTRVGRRPAIALRVNPNVGSGTHAKISTGKGEDKFGVSSEEALHLYSRAASHPALDLKGLAVHIGSQIRDLEPLERAYGVLRGLAESAREQGLPLTRLDLGGGLGVPYFNEPAPPPPSAYSTMVKRAFDGFDAELAFEPGRLIAGNAGLLLSRVIRVQERSARRILVIDAGMNDLIRPAMYGAHHDMKAVREPAASTPPAPVDVVGPICETGDTFAKDRPMPPLQAGDLVALFTAGAYGAAMSSVYNSRPLVPEVLVNGDDYAIVRRRMDVSAQIALESLPRWH